jgi:hypothetical protein
VRHVCGQAWVAVAVAEHERAELDPLGRLRDRAEQRHRFEMKSVGISKPRARAMHPAQRREREEVIPDKERVDAERLRLQPEAAEGSVVGVLRLDLDADANSPHAWLFRSRQAISFHSGARS